MSYTLLASQVPAPQVFSGLLLIPTSDTLGSSVPTGSGLASRSTVISVPWNTNLTILGLVARYGAGGWAVAYGLGLSAVSSLNLPIAQGQILCDGVKQINATTLTLPDSTARVFIWALKNGTLTYRTTTALVANAVFIGTATTSGGHVTAVDFSGVVYAVNGALERNVADTGYPSDTPPLTWRGWTVGSDGLRWWWDGTQYKRLISHLCLNFTTIPSGHSEVIPAGMQTVIYDAFTVNGTVTVNGNLKVI